MPIAANRPFGPTDYHFMIRMTRTTLANLTFALCVLAAPLQPAAAQVQRPSASDVDTHAGFSSLSALTGVNGTLFFSATDARSGTELWKSDGTSEGTRLVADIKPGGAGAFPGNLVNMNGTLYFQADDGEHGLELWKSDGTGSGTVLVKDINPGKGVSTPSFPADLGGALIFTANDGKTGFELWKTDGTQAGTVLVKDINPGRGNSITGPLVQCNGVVFFPANDGRNGTELWRTDGTAPGTTLVKDINPGLGNAVPTNLTCLKDQLYFRRDRRENRGRALEERWDACRYQSRQGDQSRPHRLETEFSDGRQRHIVLYRERFRPRR